MSYSPGLPPIEKFRKCNGNAHRNIGTTRLTTSNLLSRCWSPLGFIEVRIQAQEAAYDANQCESKDRSTFIVQFCPFPYVSNTTIRASLSFTSFAAMNITIRPTTLCTNGEVLCAFGFGLNNSFAAQFRRRYGRGRGCFGTVSF